MTVGGGKLHRLQQERNRLIGITLVDAGQR